MKSYRLLLLTLGLAGCLALPAACSNSSGDGDGDAGTGGGEGDGDEGFTGGGPPEVTCDGAGTSCTEGDACCSGYCDPDGETCSCAPVDQPCRDGTECCSGQCNPGTNTCAQILGTCAQAGTPCGNGTECCTLSCVDGLCSDSACVQDNESCGQDGECCSGQCTDGSCAVVNAPTGGTCKSSGNACADGGDCCSGLCTDGLCQIGASYCVQLNDVCVADSQCCQGVCTIADGNTTGYCATQETGGTRCGERKIAGEVCGGDCAECCSRTCAPYGPSGVTICQPSTGCRTDGELCRTANDCCGGDPDSTIPGAGQAECLRVNADDEVGRCKVGGCNPHGAICGSPDDGTAACDGSLSAPNGEKCCGANMLSAELNPCSADSLLVPRCDVLEGCVEVGGDCATADDCCGNPCVQNAAGRFVCFDAPECVPSGGPCTVSADCCVGSTCLSQPGQATGVCGSTEPPPGTGGSGMGGGSGSGGTTTVCAEYGQACEAFADCCGDVPCDQSTKTCRYSVL